MAGGITICIGVPGLIVARLLTNGDVHFSNFFRSTVRHNAQGTTAAAATTTAVAATRRRNICTKRNNESDFNRPHLSSIETRYNRMSTAQSARTSSSFGSKSGSGTGRGRCRYPIIDLHPGVGGCQHSAFLQNQVFLLDVSFSTDGGREVVVGKIKDFVGRVLERFTSNVSKL